jgi:hypothetical protein
MTSGVSATSSAVYLRARSLSPAPQRVSTRTLRPSIQPNSWRPCKKAARRVCPLVVRGQTHEHADVPHALALLCARRKRPYRCRAAYHPDEVAPPHCCSQGFVQNMVARETSGLKGQTEGSLCPRWVISGHSLPRSLLRRVHRARVPRTATACQNEAIEVVKCR